MFNESRETPPTFKETWNPGAQNLSGRMRPITVYEVPLDLGSFNVEIGDKTHKIEQRLANNQPGGDESEGFLRTRSGGCRTRKNSTKSEEYRPRKNSTKSEECRPRKNSMKVRSPKKMSTS